jgi:hypothetical protein
MKRKSSELTVEFKRAALALMAPGVKVSALARELGVVGQRDSARRRNSGLWPCAAFPGGLDRMPVGLSR